MEECPEFCLGGGCCDEFEDGANNVEETVEFYWFVFSGREDRKYIPAARLRALDTERQDASLCTFKIISEAVNLFFAFGCVLR